MLNLRILLMLTLSLVVLVACGSAEPVIQEVEVTVETVREVEVEKEVIVETEVTREVVQEVTVEVPVEVEVETEVEVTRIVEIPAEGTVTKLTNSPVFLPFDDQNPLGESLLARTGDTLYSNFTTTGLESDQAMTLWAIFFNYPELCEAGPFECSPIDLGADTAAQGDFVFIDGAVIGEDGMVSLEGTTLLNDSSGSGLLELPDGCVPPHEGCGGPIGLLNPEGALVILALHSHGPVQAGDMLESQLNSYLGGCSVGVIGSLPGGFSASPDEIPMAEGECSTIHISPHAP